MHQHPQDFFFFFFFLFINFSLFVVQEVLLGLGFFNSSLTTFSLINLAISWKASTMFMLSLADVSKNGMPYWSAIYFPSEYSTTLSSKSHLFPIRSLQTQSLVCSFIYFIQPSMFLKLSLLFTAQVSIIPVAPL